MIARGEGPPAPPTPAPDAPAAPASTTPPTDPYSAMFKAISDDVDPAIMFFVLIPFTIERTFALRNLFTTVPDAFRAMRELVRYGLNRAELLKVKAAIKNFRAKRPVLFENLETAATAYQARLDQLDILLKELEAVPGIARNPRLVAEIENALKEWQRAGDFSPVDDWIAGHRKSFLKSGAGGNWAQRYDTWKKREGEDARELAFHSNQITSALNAGLRETEAHPALVPSARTGALKPGVFFVGGAEIKAGEIVSAAERRCGNLMALLTEKRSDLRTKVGPLGLLNQAHKIASPIGTIATAGGLIYLNMRAYENSIRRHGKTPDLAKADVARQSQIANEVSIKAETSLDGQIAKRGEELKPFTDVVVQVLQENQDTILEKLKEYVHQNPGTRIDWKKKRELFAKNADLAFQVRQALPFAAQTRIGKDLNMDQLLKFLSLPSKEDRVSIMQQRFLNTVYARVLDNIFPELESVREVNDDVITVGAGSLLGTPIRNSLVKSTLPKMEKMHLVVPPNVSPHPAIPDVKAEAPLAVTPPPGPQASLGNQGTTTGTGGRQVVAGDPTLPLR